MKPHRRRKTPPRREKGGHSHEANARPPAGTPPPPPPAESIPPVYEEESQPYVDPGDVIYDPGQALAEEGSNPYDEAASTEGFVDPNQQGSGTHYEAYVEPGAEQLGAVSEQGYGDPNQAYVEQPAALPPPPPPEEPKPASDAGVYDDVPTAHQRKTRPRKKMAKKSIAKNAGPLRPPAGAPAGRPGSPLGTGVYSRPLPKKGGISVMTVFLTLCAVIMLVIVTIVTLPENLKGIGGYPASAAVAGEARNLLDEGQKLMVAREGELVLSEEQVNNYLNERLQGKQGGLVAIFVRFRGVYIDFTPGFAEVFVERQFLGIPLTMSVKIKGEKFRRQMVYTPAEWSIGKMHFKSRNIKPVIEMFMRLRNTMEDEYLTLQMMSEVRFEQDRLVLDPSAGN